MFLIFDGIAPQCCNISIDIFISADVKSIRFSMINWFFFNLFQMLFPSRIWNKKTTTVIVCVAGDGRSVSGCCFSINSYLIVEMGSGIGTCSARYILLFRFTVSRFIYLFIHSILLEHFGSVRCCVLLCVLLISNWSINSWNFKFSTDLAP